MIQIKHILLNLINTGMNLKNKIKIQTKISTQTLVKELTKQQPTHKTCV